MFLLTNDTGDLVLPALTVSELKVYPMVFSVLPKSVAKC